MYYARPSSSFLHGVGGSVPRRLSLPLFALLFSVGLAGCGGDSVSAGDEPRSTSLTEIRPTDGLFESDRLPFLISAAVENRMDEVVRGLSDPSLAVRRRAALLAASLRDPQAIPTLIELLSDDDAGARRDAAFALGEAGRDGVGDQAVPPLIEALAGEEDGVVRRALLLALGRIGGESAARTILAAMDSEDDAGSASWALAHLAVGDGAGNEDQAVVRALASTLSSQNPEARQGAAWALWRLRASARVGSESSALIDALDTVRRDDPARGWVVGAAISLSGGRELSSERLVALVGEDEALGTRILALRSLMGLAELPEAPVRNAVYAALSGPSPHVAITAAEVAASWIGAPETGGMARWQELEGAIPNLAALQWQRLRPLFPALTEVDAGWVRRWMSSEGAQAGPGLAHAIRALGAEPDPETETVLFSLTGHPDPLVRAALVDALGQIWDVRRGEPLDEETMGRFGVFFADETASGAPASAMRAARRLLDPAFAPLQAQRVLEETVALRYREGHHHMLDSLALVLGSSRVQRAQPILDMLLTSNLDYRIRRSGDAGFQAFDGRRPNPDRVAAPNQEYPIDWREVSSLGPRPRLEIVTERGRLLLELDAEQAPQTVQAIADQAAQGLHNGTRFHRVVSNFVVQAGDVSLGDGTGGPGYRIRTETTWIPFERGVIGMASSGRNTEGSQWFITHSRQPHLDGAYTAFGWVLEGWEVLDQILEGDRIVTMTVTPDPQWFARF
jgi:cyclophilin family peptidyl-prolyl cis-trans isomerase/HEAT repeat protein